MSKLANAALKIGNISLAAAVSPGAFRDVLASGIEVEREVSEICAYVPDVTREEVAQSIKEHGYQTVWLLAVVDGCLPGEKRIE